jgi:hypothetical protein
MVVNACEISWIGDALRALVTFVAYMLDVDHLIQFSCSNLSLIPRSDQAVLLQSR